MNLYDLAVEFDCPTSTGDLTLVNQRSVGSIIVGGASKGERHNSLLRAIGVDRRAGLSDDLVLARAREINTRTGMALDESEILTMIRSTKGWTKSTIEVAPLSEYVPRNPTWADEPATPHVSLRLAGRRICSPGNLSVLISNPGSGKSSICGAILAARINPECDSLGFSVPVSGLVAYVDTEQSREDHWVAWRRFMRRAGLDKGVDMPTDKVGFYCLKQFGNVGQRIQWLLDTMKSTKPVLLLIDGLGDLVADVNDPAKSNELIQTLLAAADESDTALFATIHGNPSTGNKDNREEKARGHLGSEAMRKAESVMMIKKSEAGIRTVTTAFLHGKNRSDGEASASFQWSDEAAMMVTSELAGGANRPAKVAEYDMIVAQLREIKAHPWPWKELIDAIARIQGKSISAAKSLHVRMAERGLITNQGDGWCVGEMPRLNLLNWG